MLVAQIPMPACPPKTLAWRRLAVSSLIAALLVGASPLAAAATSQKNQKSHTAAPAKPAAKKAPSKPASKAPSQSKSSAKSAPASKSGQGRGKVCYETVTRNGRKQRVKVPCQPAEPVLSKSPISAKALEQSGQPLDNSPVKARSAPIRAYAVDGTTFFHNGRKFRIEGLDSDSGVEFTHEHAAQRLQQILDSGSVTTEALGPDDSGAMRAIVRVDGRDVAELMKQKP